MSSVKQNDLLERVRMDFIRYANCWEDADILIEGLKPEKNSKILSVASAGDNSFSLLCTDPSVVVAADINPVQLYLVELKKAAIEALGYEDFLAFIGVTACSDREVIFDRIADKLSMECLTYWLGHFSQIKSGLIYQGKFEKYFQLFRGKIMPWIHRKGTVNELFRDKTVSEQELFYQETWNSWRWRLLFRIFFSKTVMGKFGRDPEFLKEVKVDVGTYIFGKAEKHLRSTNAQSNYLLHFIHLGNFGRTLPHYLRRENYEIIRSRIDRLQIVKGSIEEVARTDRFNCFNLSNIFEYLPKDVFLRASEQLLEHAADNARFAYWNLMVPRRISGSFPGKAEYMKELSQSLTSSDKGFFYNQFIVDRKL